MREWMLEHAGESPVASVCAAFEERFGQPLSKSQVSPFRAQYGIGRRRGSRTAHRKDPTPVGAERVVKGYVAVKVREFATVPQTKDNWRFKHVLAWERANGRELPRGWMVLFADHDTRNFDPDNLVAVPRELIGVMNGGPKWHDRESCEAAVALARLKRAVNNAANPPAVCGVCGRPFEPDNRTGALGYTQKTCRACLDAGRRSPKDYGEAVCEQCGRTYRKHSSIQKFCSKECCLRSYRKRKKEVGR